MFRQRWQFLAAGSAILTLALLGWPHAGSAQAIGGTVVDAESGTPLSGAEVELLDPEGSVVDRTVTEDGGTFYLPTDSRAASVNRVRAALPSYLTVESEPVEVGAGEMVEVELRLSRSPIELDPLEVIARRPDPRHAATFEGVLIRHERFPSVGSRRVVLQSEFELRGGHARIVDVVAQFLPRPRGCIVIYRNGQMVSSRLMADSWLQATPEFLEALEYFRSQPEAPLAYQGIPSYASSPGNCSVVSLWTQRGTAEELSEAG